MAIIDVELSAESQTRYLTYALSVVSSRALPDVRDGLKPVQRRILYAMANNLNLTPDRGYRKSAAVVGEVLARFHPHGDSACYDAMVRMAQDFSLRYPLVDGQGNFGSLDGDAAAAYRYTEARLTNFAMEVIGDIGQATVVERENFDQTTMEPVVLPSRVPNLLVNGASGIAVGMATAIPPHNLRDVVKALLLLIETPDAPDTKLISAVKGPDFPTGCLILNTPQELREIYTTGKGAVRMRSSYKLEKEPKGKEKIIITSIPYAIDKSALVEKIADLIIARKVPQLVDVRDESTDEVRIVLELATGADAEKALAYLFKQTTLQHNFNVNLTALIPSSNPHAGRPQLLGLRDMLQHFLDFRVEVTRAKLLFEKGKLDDRIHVLEGLVKIFDVLDEVIEIVRKSEGRSDAATRLQKRFGLSERQALFIVDLRIYQLSRTSVDEIVGELKEKSARVAEIVKILASEALLKGEVAADLKRVVDEYGDARRSEIVNEFEEPEFDKEDFVQHEQVHVVVTQEGWMKRIRTSNDPNTTRMREGDSLLYTAEADTRDMLVVFSNLGNVYGVPVFDLAATPGFGEPVQKILKFADNEQILSLRVVKREQLDSGGSALPDLFVYSVRGFGFRVGMDQIVSAKRSGKRLMKLGEGDTVQGIVPADKQFVFLLSALGYGLYFLTSEVPKLNTGAKGVFLQKLPEEDRLIGAVSVGKGAKLTVTLEQGSPKELELSSMTIMTRARRGDKVIKRGSPVAVAVVAAKGKETVH